MKRLRYPGTEIEIRIGDLVRWHDDEEPSKVVFVISTGQFPEGETGEWYTTEFGEGIMIDTPEAGWVLENEDCQHITLVRSASDE